ncbi:MAG: response regulator transcription factor [Coriobacteriales bacterium]|jgi:DNA-binding response OmpR family regulator|nr:response regulator transcription factor [Coriobacteriales bacterium]
MPGIKTKVLLVEDEKSIRKALLAYLHHENYIVTVAEDGAAALDAFFDDEFDLIILDLMLPKVSGEQVCKTIRKSSMVPIIMLTAKGDIKDRIAGLDLGADDYLVKPFSPRELMARARAILRRVAADSIGRGREQLTRGDLVIDTGGRKVFQNGKPIDMTASEYKLLVAMARHPGQVFSRIDLVKRVLGYDFDGYERTIDSHIKNLRAKLGDDPRHPRWLFTVHGVGYRFETGEDQADAAQDTP